MSERTPTKEQRAAIEAAGAEVLVEAGAGSGKTGVMVERYCRLVCEQGISPEEVLAFTFTEKAATELRRRIRAEIEARAATGSERAQGLLAGLGSAWVTTIHGFCNRLLASHPVAVGIDPRFRVLDAPEAERAADEAFEEALEEFLSAGDAEREATVAAFDVAGLRAMVVGAHAELRSRGQAEPELPDPLAVDLDRALARTRTAALEALEELKPTDSRRTRVERAAELLSGGATPSLDQLAPLHVKSKAKALVDYCEAIEAAIGAVAEAGEGGRAYRHVAELLSLFGERFAAAKQRRAGIDFEDLQLLAARLLENSGGEASYRGRFSHLLVDEFQDTNRLQLRLIEGLRGPETKLMVVGDELQSIYGFRHADLDVFRRRRDEIEAGAGGELLALSGNFRSRPEVIGAVNAFGEVLLGDAYNPLRVGGAPPEPEPPGGGPAVEMLLTGRDGWDAEGIDLEPTTDARIQPARLAEARFLAARLRRLADAGVPRGEMVVLLRAFTDLDAHEDSLERAGLRPYVVGGRGYWSQQQVADVCALLATIANPLDDQALFGALASPACGASPDTLWLLRAAAGRGRHVWPAVEQAAGLSEDENCDGERLTEIPAREAELLGRFARTLIELRARAGALSLPGLIDATITETGYDLAVLMRPSGEARFANLRKLMRIAAEFEASEGRDLRRLLDFLATRSGADSDPQAATAVEGHDGVRIMTIHNAKGLEFEIVALPHLSRGLLDGWRAPSLALGREAEAPRIGMKLRRLGAPTIDLFSYRELREEAQRREAEEELRLFHVGATRARERLLLSGVIKPEANASAAGAAVIERLTAAFDVDRERDSATAIPAPEARPGLETEFNASEIAVRVSLASPERAAELTRTWRDADALPDPGRGPAPLLERRPARPVRRPLSYTAISAHEEAPEAHEGTGGADAEDGAARGRAVHSMLEWSHSNGWREPGVELAGRFATAAGIDPATLDLEALLRPFRAWLSSPLFAERVRDAERSRVEVPLLLRVADTVLRGSIDLLIENAAAPPLIVDYKTDRLGTTSLAVRVQRYETQRDLYALAVSEARGVDEVEVAYVFLERPEEPVVETLDGAAIDAGRRRLETKIEGLGQLTEPIIPPGPAPASPPARPASAP